MKEGNERLTVWIDPDIKQRAKLRALKNRVALSGIVEFYLRRYADEKPPRFVGNGKSK